MKKYINIALSAFAAIALSACVEEFTGMDNNAATDGYMTIGFMTDVPAMDVVQTKAVDPDGAGVQQMTVFCFDQNGLFITTVTASLDKSSQETGKMEVTVPDHTVTMHLVGNQNLTYFKEDNYRGMSEVEVMSSLEASAGRMIYWGRATVEELKACNSTDKAMKLLRNQAKITLAIDDQKTEFVETGWVVVNTSAFGTVAPYCPEHGFEAPHYSERPFVTLPENNAKLGEYLDVRVIEEEYIFETENTEADPIDFIIRGKNSEAAEELYYRVSLLDLNGDHVKILRNHHYIVNVVGDLKYGQKTFAEALNAPATNNVWVSISDSIKEVQDGEYKLSVEKTSVVIGEEEFNMLNTYFLSYSLTALSGGELTKPSVRWMDGNNVALTNFSHEFDQTTGEGTIIISLNALGDLQKREGTLFIKAGRLSRKIKVVTVKQQSFIPAWVTTNIYGGQSGENVTMMFTISEDCPKELFPMDVLVSVNALDVRSESGMKLPVVYKGDEAFGEDNGIGYKYRLTVDKAGVQRLYLETTLSHNENETVEISIEAPYFKPLTKIATFRHETDYSIILDNVRYYSAEIPEDEVIFYYLVPQKIGAEVTLETHLAENAVWNNQTHKYDYTPVDPAIGDMFLFYSRHLDHNDAAEHDHYFDFTPVNEGDWGTGGRVHSFERTSLGTTETHGAVFCMKTNTPKSAEVVRIASNPESTGNHYRSAVFELANFHPFHFSATVNGEGTVVAGDQEEKVDEIMFSYQPDQTVTLEFDVTSFTETVTQGTLDEQVSVDPFGTEFDIFIDAPMLKLDENGELFKAGKIRAHDSIEGRFVYTVNASRDAERSGDLMPARDVAVAEDVQKGERKQISFKTNSIVSAGEITISSDESKVVFFQKKYNVHNSSIKGVLKYMKDGVETVVPAGSFVPFEIEPTYNRIGTVTVSEGGQFELRLRSEYKYDWDTDNVGFQFSDGGKVYEFTFDSLRELFNHEGDILLN